MITNITYRKEEGVLKNGLPSKRKTYNTYIYPIFDFNIPMGEVLKIGRKYFIIENDEVKYKWFTKGLFERCCFIEALREEYKYYRKLKKDTIYKQIINLINALKNRIPSKEALDLVNQFREDEEIRKNDEKVEELSTIKYLQLFSHTEKI